MYYQFTSLQECYDHLDIGATADNLEDAKELVKNYLLNQLEIDYPRLFGEKTIERYIKFLDSEFSWKAFENNSVVVSYSCL